MNERERGAADRSISRRNITEIPYSIIVIVYCFWIYVSRPVNRGGAINVSGAITAGVNRFYFTIYLTYPVNSDMSLVTTFKTARVNCKNDTVKFRRMNWLAQTHLQSGFYSTYQRFLYHVCYCVWVSVQDISSFPPLCTPTKECHYVPNQTLDPRKKQFRIIQVSGNRGHFFFSRTEAWIRTLYFRRISWMMKFTSFEKLSIMVQYASKMPFTNPRFCTVSKAWPYLVGIRKFLVNGKLGDWSTFSSLTVSIRLRCM